jgi:hypothetical protein
VPNFSTEIPKEEKAYGFDLRRTPADKAIEAICIQEDLIGCFTHFYHGRTSPCEGSECPACADSQPARWHGYLGAFDPRNHEQFIFEFTLKPAEALRQYRDTYGTLRGCIFNAHRPKRTKNARIILRCKPIDLTKITIPEPIDMVRALCTIWQLPWTAMKPAEAADQNPTIEAEPSRLDAMYGRSPNRNGHGTTSRSVTL